MKKWILTNDIDDIKGEFGTRHHGFYFGSIYAIEYGEFLKIGYSNNPYGRVRNLISSSKNYGKMSVGMMLISPLHTNYKENEKYLHNYFKESRIRAELFQLNLLSTRNEIEKIKLLDESKQKAQEAEETATMFMNFVKGESPLFIRERSK